MRWLSSSPSRSFAANADVIVVASSARAGTAAAAAASSDNKIDDGDTFKPPSPPKVGGDSSRSHNNSDNSSKRLLNLLTTTMTSSRRSHVTSSRRRRRKASQKQQQQQEPLPPPPHRKPRGCRCCTAPLEGRRSNHHQQQQQRHPLWESNGKPGLGWWSDTGHAAEAAAIQVEWRYQQQRAALANEKTRDETGTSRRIQKKGERTIKHNEEQPQPKAQQDSDEQAQDQDAHGCNNNLDDDDDDADDDDDLFFFGGIGDLMLPKPTPITELQDKHLAKQIASFAKARANEAAKSRQFEQQMQKMMLLSSTSTSTSTTKNNKAAAVGSQDVENDDDPLSKMALFEYEELQLGALLGVGGFSHVYEIQAFNLWDGDTTTASAADAAGSSSTNSPASAVGEDSAAVAMTASSPSLSPRKSRSSFPSTRRRSSAASTTAAAAATTASGGRLSFSSFSKASTTTTTTTAAGANKLMMNRRRSSSSRRLCTSNNHNHNSTSYTPQQQLAREFLAEHALRPDDDVTEHDGEKEEYDDDDDDDDASRILNSGVPLSSRRRRASSILSIDNSNVAASWNPAEHTREENSAYFRETRESVSTHLMENSTSFFSQDFQEELQNAARGSGKTTARYAVKHLKPSLLQETPLPNKFAKAAMDLACEAEMMMGLNHPNIVKLRGFATGGPGKFKDGKHTSYFLIMDRLTGTLQDRIAEWRQTHKEQYSWKRRLDFCWKRSKVIASNCLRFQRTNKRRQSKTKGSPSSNSNGNSSRAHRSGSFSAAPSSRSFGCGPPSSSFSATMMTPEQLLLVERVKVAYDIACALEYLHEKRIVYRDLKSTNIGFNVRGDVQIFDFGLSRYLPSNDHIKNAAAAAAALAASNEDEKETESLEIRRDNETQQQEQQQSSGPRSALDASLADVFLNATEFDDDELFVMSHVGTRRYTAPEVDCKQPYNRKADVYSFGVVLWEMMAMASAVSKGRKINLAQDHASVVSAKSNGKDSNHNKYRKNRAKKKNNRRRRIMVPCCCWPVPIQTLVRTMMADNPNNRPTMQQVRAVLEQVYLSLRTTTNTTTTTSTTTTTTKAKGHLAGNNNEHDEYSYNYNAASPDGGEDENSDMYLLKRQRRRSTFCLETWAQEVAMEDFLVEEEEENEDDETDDDDDDDVDAGGSRHHKEKNCTHKNTVLSGSHTPDDSTSVTSHATTTQLSSSVRTMPTVNSTIESTTDEQEEQVHHQYHHS